MASSLTALIQRLKDGTYGFTVTPEYDTKRDGLVFTNEKGQKVFISKMMLRTTRPETLLVFVLEEFESYTQSAEKVADLMNTYSLQTNSWIGQGSTTTTGGLRNFSGTMYPYQQQQNVQNDYFKIMLGNTLPEEEPRMQIKLTLKEAQFLEEITGREPMLKDILAKIEEGADFQIVVSFRDKDDD